MFALFQTKSKRSDCLTGLALAYMVKSLGEYPVIVLGDNGHGQHDGAASSAVNYDFKLE